MRLPDSRDKRWQPVQRPPDMPGTRRVLVLSHMFPHPEQPGSGPFILEQVQALRRAGVDARVVCGRPYWFGLPRNPLRVPRMLWHYYRMLQRAGEAWYLLDEVPVCYLPYAIFAPFWSHGWSYRTALRAHMARLQREFAPELVHAHTGYLDGSAARMLARAWNVPYVITEHTGPFSALVGRKVVRGTTVRAMTDADRVVSVSRALQADVLAHVPAAKARAMVIPNVVDADRFEVGRTPLGAREAPRLLFVGYFVDVKNLPLLLDAFTIVLAYRPRATLQLVGGGETEEQTRAVVADIAARGLQGSVRVRGFVPREEVARLMRDETDVFVLPSRSETFGCVAAEALASGRPVVATRCGGPEDIVTEPWMGALSDNGDAPALARAILDVADRLPELDPQRLGASARERFGGPAVARRLMRLYHELLRPADARAAAELKTDGASR